MENNNLLERKLKMALNALHKMLNNYENSMIDICNKQIKDTGYNVGRSYVHKGGPHAYNSFDDNSKFYFSLY